MKKNYLTIAFTLAALLMTFAPSMSISAHAARINASPVIDDDDDDDPEELDFYKQVPIWDGSINEKTHLPAGWTVSFPEASADQYDDLVKSIECRHFDEVPYMTGNAVKIPLTTNTKLVYTVKLADLGITPEMIRSGQLDFDCSFDLCRPGIEVNNADTIAITALALTDEGKAVSVDPYIFIINTLSLRQSTSLHITTATSNLPTTIKITMLITPQAGKKNSIYWLGNMQANICTNQYRAADVSVSNSSDIYYDVYGEGYYPSSQDKTVNGCLYIQGVNPEKQIAWKDATGNIVCTDSIFNFTAKVPEPTTSDDGDVDGPYELNYTVWPYDKLRKAKVAAEGDGQVSLTSNGGFKGATEAELCPGESITCHASSTPTSLFAFWKDENGKVVSKDTVYTFQLTEGDEEVVRTAVFQKLDKEVSYTIPEKWSTFYYRKDIMLPEEVMAYKIDYLIEDGTKVAVTTPINIGQSIKAYTPVLLKNEYDHPVTITLLTCDNPADTTYTQDADGLLQGTLVDTTAPDSSYVLLKKNDIFDFYLNDSSVKSPEVKAFTCWLKLPRGTVTFPSILKLESKTTGIVSVSTDDKADDKQTIYNLAGQKVAIPQRGHLYIVNGRKRVW